MILLDIRRRTK